MRQGRLVCTIYVTQNQFEFVEHLHYLSLNIFIPSLLNQFTFQGDDQSKFWGRSTGTYLRKKTYIPIYNTVCVKLRYIGVGI